jgi:hypothetical protein
MVHEKCVQADHTDAIPKMNSTYEVTNYRVTCRKVL